MNESSQQGLQSVDNWYRRPILLGALLVSGLMLAGVCLASPNFGQHENGSDTPIAGDFLQEWIGAYSLRMHGPASLFELDALKAMQHDEQLIGCAWSEDKYYAMVYPPFYYAAWIPFTWVSYPVAAYCFIALMILAHLISMVLLVQHTSYRHPDDASGLGLSGIVSLGAFWPLMIVLFTIFTPVVRSITTGQKGTLCLLILTVAYLLLQRRRPFMSGLVFGLIAFKPHLALVIGFAMLWRRQWAFVAGSVATASLLAGICLAMGWDVCVEYTRFCLGAGDYVNFLSGQMHKSHCLYGFLALASGGQTNWINKSIWLIALALIAWMLVCLFRRHDQARKLSAHSPTAVRSTQLAVEFSALVLATILLAPHLFTYDLTMLILPMTLTLVALAQGYFSGLSKPAVLIALIGIHVAAGFSLNLAFVSGYQASTPLMLVWLMLLGFPKISWPAGATTPAENCDPAQLHACEGSGN